MEPVQPPGRHPRRGREYPGPEARQQLQGRLVRGQPLTVPRGGADHGQGLHPGGGVDPGERRRDREPGLSRPYDKPASQAHQGRGRGGGKDRERQPDREPPGKLGPAARPARVT